MVLSCCVCLDMHNRSGCAAIMQKDRQPAVLRMSPRLTHGYVRATMSGYALTAGYRDSRGEMMVSGTSRMRGHA